MTTWTEDEVEAVILTHLPDDWRFSFGFQEGVWVAQFHDQEGVLQQEERYPDKRLTLLNAYGHIWRRFFKPSNPVWQRRRDDLRVVARSGLMHLPGADTVPDPDDFDPASVYDLDPTRRTR